MQDVPTGGCGPTIASSPSGIGAGTSYLGVGRLAMAVLLAGYPRVVATAVAGLAVVLALLFWRVRAVAAVGPWMAAGLVGMLGRGGRA